LTPPEKFCELESQPPEGRRCERDYFRQRLNSHESFQSCIESKKLMIESQQVIEPANTFSGEKVFRLKAWRSGKRGIIILLAKELDFIL
jgi:hypothetical protein